MTTPPAVTAVLERFAGTFVAPRTEEPPAPRGRPLPGRGAAPRLSGGGGGATAAARAVAVRPSGASGGAAAAPRSAVAPAVAVLAHRDDVVVAGGAVALAVARECRAPAAVVCVWTGGEPARRHPAAPASAPAHRLAQALARRGHAARASRRLVHVALPAGQCAAATEAARVGAACGAAPLVLALAGAREAAFDALLRASDLVVVAGAPGTDPALAALAALALAGVEALGVRGVECALPAAPVARLLAATGAGLVPSARGGVGAVVEALR